MKVFGIGLRRIYAGLVLYTVFPILSVLAAMAISLFTGANLSKGSVTYSPFMELLYGMFLMHWLAAITIPTGVCALLIFTLFVLIQRWHDRPR